MIENNNYFSIININLPEINQLKSKYNALSLSLSFSISLVKTFCLQSLIVKKTMYLDIFYLDQIKLDIFHTCRWVNVLCG